MEVIKDCQSHVVCFADAKTGLLESKYKKQITRMVIPIGSEITIIRDETQTVIKRISESAFEVLSSLAAA